MNWPAKSPVDFVVIGGGDPAVLHARKYLGERIIIGTPRKR
jgi:hypothetical protein